MSAISERTLQENLRSAQELAVQALALTAQESTTDDSFAMVHAEYAAVKGHTAVINNLRELLLLAEIDDTEHRLSHQDIVNAVCVAANAAGTASTKGFHPTLDDRWQALAPHVRAHAAAQMAIQAINTALSTAHRLLTEINEAPVPGPDPGLSQAAKTALQMVTRYRDRIRPALDQLLKESLKAAPAREHTPRP